MGQNLYDESYKGDRYTYVLRVRPLAQYNVPNGWIIGSGKPHPASQFGTVDYPVPLTDEEMSHFTLCPVLKQARFRIESDDAAPTVIGYHDGTTWNGWMKPKIEREAVVRWLTDSKIKFHFDEHETDML